MDPTNQKILSKSEIKAARRLKQESQRAAKTAGSKDAKPRSTNKVSSESSIDGLRKTLASTTLEPSGEANGTKPTSKPNEMTEPNVDCNAKSPAVHQESQAAPKDAEMSKAELKAARRLKQETQRAAKAAGVQKLAPQKTEPPKVVTKTVQVLTVVKPGIEPGIEPIRRKPSTTSAALVVRKQSTVAFPHRVKLFNHLYNNSKSCLDKRLTSLHPAITRLGVQYSDRIILGSNARCLALLNAMKSVVMDHCVPPQKDFARSLEENVKTCMAYLRDCRPPSVSMTNAVRHLNTLIHALPNNVAEDDAKKFLVESIETYIRDQIDMAAQAICITVQSKVSDNDVILTYGCSSLVKRILIEAHGKGIAFRVIVVDSRPMLEGREMLNSLVKHGIRCSYILISATSFIMREATKVLLGSHALLANGYVMSRVGSSQVALIASAFNVPVLVCCETHKFVERVQTDSFVHNELGDPDRLMPASTWRNITALTPLNLCYDVTPPQLVTAVVTELAILPCTSVPVVLRVKV